MKKIHKKNNTLVLINKWPPWFQRSVTVSPFTYLSLYSLPIHLTDLISMLKSEVDVASTLNRCLIFLIEISWMGSDVGWIRGEEYSIDQKRNGTVKGAVWPMGGWGRDAGEGCSGMQVGVVWFGCCMQLHIPLFLRNDRAVGLRDHIIGYLRFRVILES